MTVLETLAAIGMAVGPPLAYSDQLVSIMRKKSSAGFSTDVCGVLIVANVTRVVYWMAERFQLACKVLLVCTSFQLHAHESRHPWLCRSGAPLPPSQYSFNLVCCQASSALQSQGTH
jgi:hypothetical protein